MVIQNLHRIQWYRLLEESNYPIHTNSRQEFYWGAERPRKIALSDERKLDKAFFSVVYWSFRNDWGERELSSKIGRTRLTDLVREAWRFPFGVFLWPLVGVFSSVSENGLTHVWHGSLLVEQPLRPQKKWTQKLPAVLRHAACIMAWAAVRLNGVWCRRGVVLQGCGIAEVWYCRGVVLQRCGIAGV